MQVHAFAFQILTLGRVVNHDDVYIKHVIDSIWGLDWNDLTPQTQRANDYFVRQAYQDMLDSYLPKLREHLEETEGILNSTVLAWLAWSSCRTSPKRRRSGTKGVNCCWETGTILTNKVSSMWSRDVPKDPSERQTR